jgi:chromosome segregation ATPase
MKGNIRTWVTGALGAVLLLAGCGRQAEEKLELTQRQLTTVSNQLVEARSETADVKTQMQAKISELQQTVLKLTEEKADTEKKMMSLRSEVDKAQQQIAALEQEKTALTGQIGDVSRKLADLEHTHAMTVAHLQAMREDYVKLTNQMNVLEAKLHDLKALKEQIYVVKQDLHEKKVAERKRLDRAESAMGNHGYFVRNGAVVTARTPGKYPLNQEMHLAE